MHVVCSLIYSCCVYRNVITRALLCFVCSAVEKQASLPSETENANTWIIVGVVVPVLVVMIIISILYWKLCRTDKLEFQPDTMSAVQQRQKVRGEVHCDNIHSRCLEKQKNHPGGKAFVALLALLAVASVELC